MPLYQMPDVTPGTRALWDTHGDKWELSESGATYCHGNLSLDFTELLYRFGPLSDSAECPAHLGSGYDDGYFRCSLTFAHAGPHMVSAEEWIDG